METQHCYSFIFVSAVDEIGEWKVFRPFEEEKFRFDDEPQNNGGRWWDESNVSSTLTILIEKIISVRFFDETLELSQSATNEMKYLAGIIIDW